VCEASILGVFHEILHMTIIDPGETILRDWGRSNVATDVIDQFTLRDTVTHVNIHFPLPSVSRMLLSSSRLRSDSSMPSLLAVSTQRHNRRDKSK